MTVDSTHAVVITEPGRLQLQRVTLKEIGPDDVVIQTTHTSISAGTERMLLAGQMPHPMLGLPAVPGYETVGRVVRTGKNVDPGWLDQQVYVGGALCYADVSAAWGGQSALLFTDVSRVIPLGAIPPEQGVLLALAATALHGVDLLDPKLGQRMLVLGQGPVGQLAARFLKARSAWVAVADLNDRRLARSAADLLVNVTEEPLAQALDEPVDVIVEATGSMAALADALPLLAQGGTILLLGYYQTLDLPYMPLFLKEAQLRTAKEWAPGDLVRCRDELAQGTLDVSSLVTHHFPIEQVVEAYDVALNEPDCLKLVLDWTSLEEGAATDAAQNLERVTR